MYKWYKNSSVCFVYLADVPTHQSNSTVDSLGHFSSSWFNRALTLQESIAPRTLEFYSSEWTYNGNKKELAVDLSGITGIDEALLLRTTPVKAYSMVAIMSWTSHRVTTRREDIAYCLLGLLDVHMPPLYGEGNRAFIRLQEEILKQSSDQSIFAWNPSSSETDRLRGIFAPSPACFTETRNVVPSSAYWDTESSLTNRGVHTRMPFRYNASNKTFTGILCCISPPSMHDIDIEFESFSAALQDYDHFIRRLNPVIYGNWSHDEDVQFNTIYLGTDVSL